MASNCSTGLSRRKNERPAPLRSRKNSGVCMLVALRQRSKRSRENHEGRTERRLAVHGMREVPWTDGEIPYTDARPALSSVIPYCGISSEQPLQYADILNPASNRIVNK